MAFNLEEMTIDYKKMFRMVPTDRATLAQSGVVNDLISSLTPGQLANLFPRYYRDRLPDIGTSATGGASLGGALSDFRTAPFSGRSGGGSYTTVPAPPSKSAQELAVERILKDNNIIPKTSVAAPSESGFFGAIMRAEGTDLKTASQHGFASSYDVVLGYGKYGLPDKPLSQMTIAEVYDYQRNVLLKNHGTSSAAGAFQIVSDNIFDRRANDLSVFMKRAGLTLNDKFDEAAQRKLAYEIYKEQGLGAWEGFKFNQAELRIAQAEAENVKTETATEEIKRLEELKAELVPLEEEIRKKLDAKTLEIYDKAGPEQKWNIEHAIRAVGVDKFNESVKEIAKTEKNVNETASVIADPNAKINTDTGRYDEEYYESIIKPFDIHSEREGSTTSLSAETKSRLGAMLRDAPDYVKEELKIQSAYRDPELQQQLYNRSGGSRYVAKNSQHSKGMAIDLGSGKGGSAQESWNNLSEETRSWIIQNSSKYGLYRPMQPGLTNVVEDWHFEPIGNRGNWQKNQPKADMSDWKDPQYTQTASQQPATNTSLSETTVATGPTVPSLASGGTVKMTPGENVAGINTNTGQVEFMSNDRELYTKDDQGNLRVDPSTIRQEEQPAQPVPVEAQRLEAPTQPLQRKTQAPVPQDNPDPNFLNTMTSGSMASSPSQLRALNRAKLYSENSSDLVNGHFS